MKLVLNYIDIYLKELIRNHSAAFFTLLFPMILFQLFGMQQIANGVDKIIIVTVFCNYAVQTVMFQALGITVATSRENPWSDYIKFLPFSRFPMLMGRILSNLIFAIVALFFVALLSQLNAVSALPLPQLLLIIVGSLLGGIPMAMLAIFLGNVLNAGAARSGFVLFNLLLLFGAVSLPDQGWPVLLKNVIPSYQCLMFSLNIANHQVDFISTLWLLAYTVTFGMIYFLVSGNIRVTSAR